MTLTIRLTHIFHLDGGKIVVFSGTGEEPLPQTLDETRAEIWINSERFQTLTNLGIPMIARHSPAPKDSRELFTRDAVDLTQAQVDTEGVELRIFGKAPREEAQ